MQYMRILLVVKDAMALLVTESQAECVQADPAGPTRQSGPCNWLIVLLPLPELCKTIFFIIKSWPW